FSGAMTYETSSFLKPSRQTILTLNVRDEIPKNGFFSSPAPYLAVRQWTQLGLDLFVQYHPDRFVGYSMEGIKQGVLLVVVAVVEEGDSKTNWAVQESKGDESKGLGKKHRKGRKQRKISSLCESVLAPTPAPSSTPALINRKVSPTRLPEPSEDAMPYGRMWGGLEGKMLGAGAGTSSGVPPVAANLNRLSGAEEGRISGSVIQP
ncbi:hypothetical protein Tco_0602312, partial [Tanacetum coccineum]